MRQKAMASRVAERSWRELPGESQLRGRPFGSRMHSLHVSHHMTEGMRKTWSLVCIKNKLVWELINFLSSREFLFLNRAGVLVGAPELFQHLNRTRCFFPEIRSVATDASVCS